MPPSDAYDRFIKSTVMNYEKWHEGIGYDLEAFRQMTPAQQKAVVDQIRQKPDKDWRDVEVLELAGTDEAHESLKNTADSGPIEARLAAIKSLANAGKLDDIDRRLAGALREAESFHGLDAALRLAAEHPGPLVRLALLQGVRDRPGEVGVNYAAMLYFLAGITKEEFDWEMRPFFLHFAQGSSTAEREAAFIELCHRLQIDPKSIP